MMIKILNILNIFQICQEILYQGYQPNGKKLPIHRRNIETDGLSQPKDEGNTPIRFW
jgi:hypothetical protein